MSGTDALLVIWRLCWRKRGFWLLDFGRRAEADLAFLAAEACGDLLRYAP